VPQSKNKPVCLAADCETLAAWILSDPTRPWYDAVRNAFIQRFAEWYLRAGGGASDTTDDVEKQWRMLGGLLFRDPPTTRNHDWRNLQTQPQIVRVLRHVWRATSDQASKGRPRSDLRRLAIQALDLRHVDPEQWTWGELARHFDIYRCTEAGHGPDCQKNWEDYRKCQKRREKDFKREAQLVAEELRKLGVKLPTQRNNR